MSNKEVLSGQVYYTFITIKQDLSDLLPYKPSGKVEFTNTAAERNYPVNLLQGTETMSWCKVINVPHLVEKVALMSSLLDKELDET